MIDKNDPRLIDYALGEMTPEEAKEFEAALNHPDNAEALKALKEFQLVAGAAKAALAQEPADRLRTEQREAVVEQAVTRNVTPMNAAPRFRYVRWYAAVAVAACLLVTVAWVIGQQRAYERGASVSHQDIAQMRTPAETAPAPEAPMTDRQLYDAARPQTLSVQESIIPEIAAERADTQESWDDAPAGDQRQVVPSDSEGFRLPLPERRSVSHPPPPPQASRIPVRLRAEDSMETLGYAPPAVGVDGSVADVTVVEDPELRYQASDAVRPIIPPMPSPRPPQYPRGERYLPIIENTFLDVVRNPLSTFSVDVDTGAYSNVRRFLQQGQLPPPDAVRIEEMVNYFQYDLPQPTGEAPFSITIEMADCPWAEGHRLARIALQGRSIDCEDRGPANLVFLIDVSGSMSPPNRLPLAKEAMKALVNELQPHDRVAIVTYAGTAETNLPSTPCTDKPTIRAAIDALRAGGSTHGSQGIQKAYRIARENFIPGGINRVILATDGDFNVGVTSHDALMDLIREEAKSNVFLTVLGFGYGNLKDATLEQLANSGNGNYAYIDTFSEARRVLVEQISGTLITIAKDVKIQVEFNPQHVQAYRLIGYENRALADRDFNDDTKDAGEIGAGHQVTALYQLVPTGARLDPGVDPLRYQPAPEPEALPDMPVNPEWMTVKLRYKEPEGDVSRLIELPWTPADGEVGAGSQDMRFAAGVAAFGMLLRDSQYKGAANYDMVLTLAEEGSKNDHERRQFIDLAVTAKTLAGN